MSSDYLHSIPFSTPPHHHPFTSPRSPPTSPPLHHHSPLTLSPPSLTTLTPTPTSPFLLSQGFATILQFSTLCVNPSSSYLSTTSALVNDLGVIPNPVTTISYYNARRVTTYVPNQQKPSLLSWGIDMGKRYSIDQIRSDQIDFFSPHSRRIITLSLSPPYHNTRPHTPLSHLSHPSFTPLSTPLLTLSHHPLLPSLTFPPSLHRSRHIIHEFQPTPEPHRPQHVRHHPHQRRHHRPNHLHPHPFHQPHRGINTVLPRTNVLSIKPKRHRCDEKKSSFLYDLS